MLAHTMTMQYSHPAVIGSAASHHLIVCVRTIRNIRIFLIKKRRRDIAVLPTPRMKCCPGNGRGPAHHLSQPSLHCFAEPPPPRAVNSRVPGGLPYLLPAGGDGPVPRHGVWGSLSPVQLSVPSPFLAAVTSPPLSCLPY